MAKWTIDPNERKEPPMSDVNNARNPHFAETIQSLRQSIPAAASNPDDNPKTALGEAKPKMSHTPTESIRLLGQVHSMGAAKYGAFNWREKTVSSTVYYDAAMRHLMAYFDGQDIDEESGLPHLAHVMACCSILLDASNGDTLNDNRPD